MNNLFYKKNAYLFVGGMRSFESTYKLNLKNLNFLNSDVFLYTFCESIKDENLISLFTKIFPNAKIFIEDKSTRIPILEKGKKYSNFFGKFGPSITEGMAGNALSMFYTWKNAYEIFFKNSRYKSIVKLRPDLQINNKLKINNLSENKIYTIAKKYSEKFNGRRHKLISDIFWIASSKNIKTVCDTYDAFDALYIKDNARIPEEMVYLNLIQNNIEIDKIVPKIDFSLIREDGSIAGTFENSPHLPEFE